MARRCVLVNVDTEAISLTGGSQLVVTSPRLRTYRTLFTLQKSTISTASNSPPPAQAGVSGGGGGGAGGPARPTSPAAAPRCCDTGRPIFQDPITGQTVCSCQYEFLNYQRLASGVPLSMYSAPYSEAAAATAATAAGMAAYFPALSADQPPFYTNTVSTNNAIH
ncbi:Homeobox protein araucan [Papilio xuthus]|uniref:Homeobox protein araucan n=1 Tax=Papilio xuthus TaxID=66420 RepID=A0A194PTD2_PAPXU|nr:Homeobox protein araucan [Papilio xuthus]